MKHRSAVLIPLVAILTLVAGALLWAGPGTAGRAGSAGESEVRPIGREVARLGDVADLEGTLRYENGEWLLECAQGAYELHLGPVGHEADLSFREGARASVRGFVHGAHIAPVVVVSEGTESRFWNEDRTPSWAGQGDRRNAVNAQGARATASRPRADGTGGLGNAEGFERGYRNEPLGSGRNRTN
ncbi:MAG: hypothetical protein JW820_02945 [Spirochaetales bacterium]|nr:hypothetical protein [Spirochaetales bacterium]